MRRALLITTALAFTVLTSACNTVAGAGKDVSHAGHEVTGEANENK